MLLGLAVLFVALCPGVLFRIPPLGNKMGGKFSSIVMHAIVFVIAVNLLFVVQEGFQFGMFPGNIQEQIKKMQMQAQQKGPPLLQKEVAKQPLQKEVAKQPLQKEVAKQPLQQEVAKAFGVFGFKK